jgi:hypothetical protein
MRNRTPAEETARAVVVALGLWSAAVALAAIEGVFAKLSSGTLAALAAFAVLYAPAMYLADRELRRFVLGLDARWLGGAALILDAALAAAILGQFQLAIAGCLVAPLAAVLTLASVERLAARDKPRSAAARSPGARPAAT